MKDTNRILIVDDETVIRELLSDILSGDGYPVESVSSAPAALDLITSRDDFVLLFTDIMMPDMDGIELIRRARKVRPSLIPIVMTGFATIETARAAVKEGAYDYVLKPFALSEVKLAVSNALERHRLQSENARL
ncbi:MAG: sigma-54-dependent Fis family transcriptional regulator, partial [Candidatus Hydrogenedentes bacterium]|nr:sigma-54-dependent Fis family transcriptional regulator [Candidatus Hydrogenedentota bacterium]